MSEQAPERDTSALSDVADAGTTDQDYGNLSVEDAPEGTTNPADLAGTANRGDDQVAHQPDVPRDEGDSQP
jgi:hypothetical protein